MKRLIIRTLTSFLLGVAFYWACRLVYWQVYPYQFVNVQEPVSVENSDDFVAPGEIIEMTVVVNKTSSIRAESVDVYADCANGDVYGLERISTAQRINEGEFVRTRYFILDPLVPIDQKCIVVFDLRYRPNPIRVVQKQWRSEPVTIKSALEVKLVELPGES